MIQPHRLVARAGVRPSGEDKARIDKDGWAGWLEWQLSFTEADVPAVREALKNYTLKISYGPGDGHGALDEERQFTALDKSIEELWPLSDWEKKLAWEERVRPMAETLAAIRLRAILSEAQLHEAVVDFWRDHFAVNHEAEVEVAIALPIYERDVLRRHAFGNFRDMLEAVAKSTCMLAYLNNASSKASPANENYARELFELHTLGADAYLNAHYDRWRDVPGATEGQPKGYIDQDVYEAARAFTGWTFESGQYIAEGNSLPETGRFTYVDAWHDPYQKRVLAQEFDPYQAPMADGQRVLDMAAFHPATSRFVAKRLCQRFVSDTPSEDLVKGAAQVFEENQRAPDQIAQTLRHILLSSEFAEALPRLQRPLFLFASLQRAAGVVLPPSLDHSWFIDGMGQKVYNWHSPAGHPLRSNYWQSPGLLIRRWRAINETWQSIMALDRSKQWDSITAFCTDWSETLGVNQRQAARARKILRRSFGEKERAINFGEEERWTTSQALSFLSSTPDFQAV